MLEFQRVFRLEHVDPSGQVTHGDVTATRLGVQNPAVIEYIEEHVAPFLFQGEEEHRPKCQINFMTGKIAIVRGSYDEVEGKIKESKRINDLNLPEGSY